MYLLLNEWLSATILRRLPLSGKGAGVALKQKMHKVPYVPQSQIASQPFLIPGGAMLVPFLHTVAQELLWQLWYKVSVFPCPTHSCYFRLVDTRQAS